MSSEEGHLVPPAWLEAHGLTLEELRRFGAEQDQLLIPRKEAVTMLVPQALLDDCADVGDLIGQALRGEITLKPLPEPYHRCFWCWLAAKLGRHDRCSHGYVGRDCPCNE